MTARKTGSVGKTGAALRQNHRPSVPTLADSRAGRGKKGLFSPKTGTVGNPRAGFPDRRYRRSRILAQARGPALATAPAIVVPSPCNDWHEREPRGDLRKKTKPLLDGNTAFDKSEI